MHYHIQLIDDESLPYIPTIKERVIFLDWLKKDKSYEKFIEIADLSILSHEESPEYYFTCIDWDNISDDETHYWDATINNWLRFISKRDWSFISSGIELNDEYKRQKFNKDVIKKIKNIDFNKLTDEQYIKLNKIL